MQLASRARGCAAVAVSLGIVHCAQFGPSWDQSVPGDIPTHAFGAGPLGSTQPMGSAKYRSQTGPSGVLWWNAIASDTDAPMGPLAASGSTPMQPSLVSNGVAIGYGVGKLVAWDLVAKNEKWTSTVMLDPAWMATDGTYVCGIVKPSEVACLGPGGETTFRTPMTSLGSDDLQVVNGTFFVLTSAGPYSTKPGTLTAYDAKTGTVKFAHAATPSSHMAFSAGKVILESVAICPAVSSTCIEVLDAASGVVLATKAIPPYVAGDGSTHPNQSQFLYVDAGKAYFTGIGGALRIDLDSYALEDAPEVNAVLKLPGVSSFRTVGLGELLPDGTLYVYVDNSGANVVCRVNVKTPRKDWCKYAAARIEHHANVTFVDDQAVDATGGVVTTMNAARSFRENWGFSPSREVFEVQ